MSRKKLTNFLPVSVKKQIYPIYSKLFNSYGKKSYSQFGEDMILRSIFILQKTGFFVDIGAHHPKRFSNTYYFYQKGWKGINVDAMPGIMKLFDRIRPNDINVETGIADQETTMTYYNFNEPAMNGFFSDGVPESVNEKYTLIDKTAIKLLPLSGLLDQYLPEGQEIDFMSIDVEGMDFLVLRSNNWKKYRPKVLVVEVKDFDTVKDIIESEEYKYLQSVGYTLMYHSRISSFFLKNEFLKNY